MRPLALARYRIWTTIRAGMPYLVFAASGAILATIVQIVVFHSENFPPDMAMRICGSAAMFAWAFHGFVVLALGHSFGTATVSIHTTVHPSDLLDSVPIASGHRALGEFTGDMTSSLLIHLCCAPLLCLVAALSPLPLTVFAWFEAVIIAGILLASSSAAWTRVVLGTGTRHNLRGLRNRVLFFFLILIAVIATTSPVEFRDHALQFFIGPSIPAWTRVLASIERPAAMIGFLAAIYFGYIAFYFISSTRHAPRE